MRKRLIRVMHDTVTREASGLGRYRLPEIFTNKKSEGMAIREIHHAALETFQRLWGKDEQVNPLPSALSLIIGFMLGGESEMLFPADAMAYALIRYLCFFVHV